MAASLVLLLAGIIAGVSQHSREPADFVAATRFASALRHQVTTDSMMAHLARLQQIADANSGNRGVGTPGYEQSLDYVAAQLRGKGFAVDTPEFEVRVPFADQPALAVDGTAIAAQPVEFTVGTPPGGVAGPLVSAPADTSSGCSALDYDGLPVAGAVVLVDRGGCPFSDQQAAAAERGAVALLIADDVDENRMDATLGPDTEVRIPVLSVTRSEGARLRADTGENVTVTLNAGTLIQKTRNVIAQTTTGSTTDVVVVGAHLDSVPWGPGINDNGSGVAAVLETALQLGSAPPVRNAVRFALWSAEELGLQGSRNYVESLDEDQLTDIAMYLNFDMLASQNPGYFVYQGGVTVPPGSEGINRTFAAYLRDAGKTPQNIAMTPRSDFDDFVLAGVPVGGLFSGAEKPMTAAQAGLWGGIAGQAFDPNYHRSTDTLRNVSRRAMAINGGGVAYAVGLYANYLSGHNGVPARDDRTRNPRPCAAGAHRSPSCGCVLAFRSGTAHWSCLFTV